MTNNPMRDEADRIVAEARRRQLAAQGENDLEQFRFPGESESLADVQARAAAYRKAVSENRVKYFRA